MTRRNTALSATALASIALLSSCVSPATGVLVLIDTDVAARVPMTITVRLAKTVDAGMTVVRTFERRAPGSPDTGDGGVTFPASFGIVPAAGERDTRVQLEVSADADGITLRRLTTFGFTPGVTGTLRIFLTARCVAMATGCVGEGACTVQRQCEEQGLTCGDDGTCVPIETPIEPSDRDASVPEVAPLQCGAYGQTCCPIGDACTGELSCTNNRCQRCTDSEEICCDGALLRPDGSTCAAAADGCHGPGLCRAGACVSDTMPDGTSCAMLDGPCKTGGVCRAGACTPVTDAPDGTECGSASGVCRLPSTCLSGVCVPRNKPNGTECGSAPNPCYTPPTCTDGSCGGPSYRGEGTQWGGSTLDRCCGGQAVQTTSNSNCGVCGVGCRAGQVCRLRFGHYFCDGCVANSDCQLGLCRTYDGAPYYCVPGVQSPLGACSGNCPAPSRCIDVDPAANYCSY